ncbi:DUF1217 domain-containing protein [Gymnodinialimonas sp. 2305UL16-5]|uniref:DUF1217 domain-containing protein n=1 Tax=Gymnodinialimonas mytili TaxID=3126503 RepID=UPI0030AF4D00
MTFQPVLPLSGYAGWQYLQSTLESQQERFSQSAGQAADRQYFKENIGSVSSAEELVGDFRLMRVALGAYGLQDDLPNRAFIEQVLSQGTDDRTDLANRLANKSYQQLSDAFGFGSAKEIADPSLSSNVDLVLNDEQYFRRNIDSVQTVDDLLSDTRLLRMALGSYGLLEDLPDKTFLKDLFDQGTSAPSALANQLENPAYKELVNAFGFSSDQGVRTAEPGFASGVLGGLDRIGFAAELEAAENSFRLSLDAAQGLAGIALSGENDTAQWVNVVTDPALRDVFASAFGISRSFDRMSLDQQLAALRDGAEAAFGSPDLAQFSDTSRIDDLMDLYADAVGFDGDILPPWQTTSFADEILTRFDRQQFEIAVGEQDQDMRLALNLTRELPAIAASPSDTTGWLTILGNPPLRTVFETAFALPAAVGSLDLDQQLVEFREASQRVLGSSDIGQFSDPGNIDVLIRSFTANSLLQQGPSATTRGAAAITLLQNLA